MKKIAEIVGVLIAIIGLITAIIEFDLVQGKTNGSETEEPNTEEPNTEKPSDNTTQRVDIINQTYQILPLCVEYYLSLYIENIPKSQMYVFIGNTEDEIYYRLYVGTNDDDYVIINNQSNNYTFIARDYGFLRKNTILFAFTTNYNYIDNEMIGLNEIQETSFASFYKKYY